MEIHERLTLLLGKIPGDNIDQKAKELGLTNQTLYNYLNGKRTPKTEFLIRLREITGVNLNWLLAGDPEVDVVDLHCANIQIDRFKMIASRFNQYVKKKNFADGLISLKLRDEIIVRIYNDLSGVDEDISSLMAKADHLLDFSFSCLNNTDDYDDMYYDDYDNSNK